MGAKWCFHIFQNQWARAIKNWAHFYKIKYNLQNCSRWYVNNKSCSAIHILKNHFQRASADFWYRKLNLIIVKCLGLMARCSLILSNIKRYVGLHMYINVDLKGYLILGASLRNVSPWITIPMKRVQSIVLYKLYNFWHKTDWIWSFIYTI